MQHLHLSSSGIRIPISALATKLKCCLQDLGVHTNSNAS